MGPLSRLFLPNHTALCVRSFALILHGSSDSTSRPSVIRPPPVYLQQRTCWRPGKCDRRLPESALKEESGTNSQTQSARAGVSVSYPITLDSLCASNGVFGEAWNLETKSVTAEQNHAGHAKPLQTSRTSSS